MLPPFEGGACLAVVLPDWLRGVVEVSVGDGDLFDWRGEQHVFGVDEVVAGVFGDFVLGLEGDGVERAGEFAEAQKIQRLRLIS